VQVPGNMDAPAHQLMRELATSSEWRDDFSAPVREWFVHDLPFYYDLLSPVAHRMDLWITEYQHILSGPEAIVEWYKGTGLRPFLDALKTPERKEQFLADYLRVIIPAFPRQSNGHVIFPFRRLFMVAYS